MEPLLEIRRAVKSFGAVRAVRGVSLSLHEGEVLALLGDNGAGKSTLTKCIAGIHSLDAGKILFQGQPASIRKPADARALGIEMVYQDLAVFDNLTAPQNFFAGRERSGPRWLGRLSTLHESEMIEATREILDRLESASRTSAPSWPRCPGASDRPSRSPARSRSHPRWPSSMSRPQPWVSGRPGRSSR